MLTSWWARRDDSRCWRSLSSGTASAHTTATSLPTAIMTLVWYTTLAAASVEVNVTSCLYPSSATHFSASACKIGDVPSWHHFQMKQRTEQLLVAQLRQPPLRQQRPDCSADLVECLAARRVTTKLLSGLEKCYRFPGAKSPAAPPLPYEPLHKPRLVGALGQGDVNDALMPDQKSFI